MKKVLSGIFLKVLSGIFLAVFMCSTAFAESVQVAVAANFTEPMKEIVAEFEKTTKHKVSLSFGATGAFYSQIVNGAPFDILLAADDTTPEKLVNEKQAVAGSRFCYAQGQLVLWSAAKGTVDKDGKILNGKFKHIAMADPKLAPYGLAAQETLEKLNLWNSFNDDKKIVTGKNIGQTLQFIESGNADIGFVAYSQIYKEGNEVKGSYWIVPSSYYKPIMQDAVILNHGKDNKAAKELMEYLKGDYALKIIKSYGYISK